MSRFLRMNGLTFWMDEGILQNMFHRLGQVVTVDVSRSVKYSDGYAIIKFGSSQAARAFLQTYNGRPMPHMGADPLNFQLEEWTEEPTNEKYYSLFVGNFWHSAQELTDLFRGRYQSVTTAEVVWEKRVPYGIVVFSNEEEFGRALTEMSGYQYQGIQLDVKKYVGGTYAAGDKGESSGPTTDSITLFVGNLDPNVLNGHLKNLFERFGDSVTVERHFPTDKKAFITFTKREVAELAMAKMDRTMLGNSVILVEWARQGSI